MRWRRYFNRKRRDEEFAREIQSYIQHEMDANLGRGMTREQAREAAIRKFGNRTAVQEADYQMNTLNPFDALWQDLKYGLRQLRLNPGFAATAILSLALGIGANTAIFQLLNAVRLKTLPVQAPQEITEVKIAGGNHGWGISPGWNSELTYPLWEQIRDHQQAFSGIFAWGAHGLPLGKGVDARRAAAFWVTGDLFRTLGVKPIRGRLLETADDRRGCGAGPVVISYGFWQREFGGQDSAIGAPLTIGEHSFRIIGVTPPEFFGLEVGKNFDIALPTCSRALGDNALDRRDYFMWVVMGRLKPDWTLQQAGEHLTAISPGIFEAVAPTGYDNLDTWKKFRLTAVPAGSGVSKLRRDYETSLWLLLGITGLVLLIACANLANLMLARATAREREMAVRLAIGASRGRLISQVLSESLLIAAVGTAFGAVLARALSQALVWFLNRERDPLQLDLAMDWRVLAFMAAAATLTCIICGLAPALRSARTEPASAMKAGGRGLTTAHERFSFQRLLVISQLAVSLVLLVGALLFVRSFWNLTTFDAGFRQDGIIFAFLEFSRMKLPKERIQPFKQELVERVRAIPGIEAVSTSTNMLLSGGSWTLGVRVPGNEKGGWSKFTWVSPGYFATMQIPLLSGRDFDRRDTATSRKVLLVNQQFVKHWLGGAANPIGMTVRSVEEPNYPATLYEVIGIVKDTKYASLREEIPPQAYAPELQHPAVGPWTNIVLRSSVPAADIIAGVKQTLKEVCPDTFMNFQVMRTMVHENLVRERLLAWLSGFFGALACLLAMIGLYGVISYMVARRQSEIGIRLALGANRSRVVWLIIRQMAVLLAIGIIGGAVLSLVAARSARTLLFGLESHDPVTLVASAGVLIAIAVLATLIPAWRASRLDPMTALRNE